MQKIFLKRKREYQKAAEKIVEAKNPDKKIQQAEDKLANRISDADDKFIEDLKKVSKQLVKNESVSLVNSGWINDNVYSKDFVNHGQRVKTYVEIAKAQGLPAYVGALQANFGNPIETGIVDLQNQISDLNNQLALSTQTLEANINNINLLEAELLTFDTQLINFNNQLTDLNAQLENTELSEDQTTIIQTQIDTLNTSISEINDEISIIETEINKIQNEISILETDIANTGVVITNTEQELATTIENVKPGVGVDSGWETVNLDINNDGVVNQEDIDA